jgi:hypothetical protein
MFYNAKLNAAVCQKLSFQNTILILNHLGIKKIKFTLNFLMVKNHEGIKFFKFTLNFLMVDEY